MSCLSDTDAMLKYGFPAQMLSTRDICATRAKNRKRPTIFPVSEKTLWRWVADGRLPEPSRIGGKAFWPASAVARLIEETQKGETQNETQAA